MNHYVENNTRRLVMCSVAGAITLVIIAVSGFIKYKGGQEAEQRLAEVPTVSEVRGSEVELAAKEENSDLAEDIRVERYALFNMRPLYKNGDMIFSHRGDVGRTDNMGNQYSSSAVELYASSGDRSITYALDGKYKKLYGTMAIRQNDSHESLWLEFYEGDMFLGKTEVLQDGVRPIDFEIDVSGVVDLTIVSKTATEYGFAYTECFYLE